MSLFPTKTRLTLLAEVADGHVVVDRYGQAAYDDPWGQRVTARWAEFVHAGWVVRPDGDEPKWQPGQLTDAGRAVLEATDG